MGLDYIRARTGKPWKKRWDRGLDRMKHASLFDLQAREMDPVVTIQITNGTCLSPGELLIVETDPGGLIVSRGLRAVGRINNPSVLLTNSVVSQGGYSEARVERVGIFGDTAEVTIR